MGDVADMMLDGDLCQVCGVYIGSGAGFPVTCGGCKESELPEAFSLERLQAEAEKRLRTKCWLCGKKLKPHAPGIEAHYKTKHPRSAAC